MGDGSLDASNCARNWYDPNQLMYNTVASITKGLTTDAEKALAVEE